MFMEALILDVGADDGERSAAGRKQAVGAGPEHGLGAIPAADLGGVFPAEHAGGRGLDCPDQPGRLAVRRQIEPKKCRCSTPRLARLPVRTAAGASHSFEYCNVNQRQYHLYLLSIPLLNNV